MKVLKVHCQRELLFYQPKVVPNEKDVLVQDKDSKQNKFQFAVSTTLWTEIIVICTFIIF